MAVGTKLACLLSSPLRERGPLHVLAAVGWGHHGGRWCSPCLPLVEDDLVPPLQLGHP